MRISPVDSHGFTGHVQKCTGQHTQSSQCDIAIVLCPVQCMRKESSFRQGRLPTASEHKVEAKKLLELPPWLESPRVLRATISGHMRLSPVNSAIPRIAEFPQNPVVTAEFRKSCGILQKREKNCFFWILLMYVTAKPTSW